MRLERKFWKMASAQTRCMMDNGQTIKARNSPGLCCFISQSAAHKVASVLPTPMSDRLKQRGCSTMKLADSFWLS